MDGTDLVCVIHHCQHPHDDPGKHDPPPPENQITLVNKNNWHVSFGSTITYQCDPNTFIENDEDHPTQTEIQVSDIHTVKSFQSMMRKKGPAKHP